MKNVSLLTKLFLVSALVLPCGQAFGMNIAKESVKSVANRTIEKIKTESKKPGFFQRPIVKACIWAGSGFGGAAVWNSVMDIRGNERLRFSPVGMIVTALGTGVYGYLLGKVDLNVKMNKQILKDLAKASLRREVIKRFMEEKFKRIKKTMTSNQEILQKNQQVIKVGVSKIMINQELGALENLSSINIGKEDEDMFKKILNEVMQEEEEKKKKWSYFKPWTWRS